jgi:hypothetical protein
MSACIIPVAPNFQDPPPTPHASLYLSDFMPVNGSVSSIADPNQGQSFSAHVSDEQVGATLYVRWAVNYPPSPDAPQARLLTDTMISPHPDGTPIDQPVPPQPIECLLLQSTTPPADGRYRLELIVADSPLSNDPSALDAFADPNDSGLVVRGDWTFIINCPVSP